MCPVRIGQIISELGTPELYVLVTADDQPVLRIDAYANSEEARSFRDAIEWGDFIVVGWGHRVFLIDLHSHHVIAHLLDGYFGDLYPSNDYLLVASGERLFRIAPDGSVVWKSELLGVDGVIVHEVKDGIIDGDGEWDPPGGWEPFRICLDSGYPV